MALWSTSGFMSWGEEIKSVKNYAQLYVPYSTDHNQKDMRTT